MSIQGSNVSLLSSPEALPARVIEADLPANDSVGSIIHIIDGVLVPGSVSDTE